MSTEGRRVCCAPLMLQLSPHVERTVSGAGVKRAGGA